ncbi:hypothetical protein [Flavobacterium terrisoli]|uniref:hypothetical protein n=1 Tax=Flavobacterium terrisoli TaxID=3242195 RepID=UPI002542F483|nr:hypothetical protein [Flavobacterium buctense]
MKYLITLLLVVIVNHGLTAQVKRNHGGRLFSDVDVYLTDGTMVNGAVAQPIEIYAETISVKINNKKNKTYDKAEVSKLVFKVAGSEMVYVKLKHDHAAMYEKKDDEIFVREFIKGKESLYYGTNSGYEIKKRKSTLVNDTNLWFCKSENEAILNLLYADTTSDETTALYEQNAKKHFNSQEIVGYIAKANYEALTEYLKQFNAK